MQHPNSQHPNPHYPNPQYPGAQHTGPQYPNPQHPNPQQPNPNFPDPNGLQQVQFPGEPPCPSGPPSGTTVPEVNRRRFLKWSGVAAAGVAAVGGGGWLVSSGELHRLAAAAGLADTTEPGGILVVVTLYGGNDGLNTVVPYEDRNYLAARPGMHYAENAVLPLGDGLGLNPAMKGLKSLWDNDSLGIVRGAGYPKPDRSHFASMAIWQTASPDGGARTGWLGSWLDQAGGPPLAALSMDPVLPPMLVGAKGAAAALVPDSLAVRDNAVRDAFRAMSGGGGTALERQVARSCADLVITQDTFNHTDPKSGKKGKDGQGKPGKKGKKGKTPSPTPQPQNQPRDSGDGKDEGQTSGLAADLDQVAGFVEAGVPTRVYSVSLGGFDTHADERGTQERLLGELDQALTRFQARLDRTEQGRKVTTMVYSEFGRRVAANEGEGTDHGTAGPMFLMGNGVRAGFHGDQPSLDPAHLDNGDLRATTDFRDVYASVLDKVLQTDPGRVLGGWQQTADGLFV